MTKHGAKRNRTRKTNAPTRQAPVAAKATRRPRAATAAPEPRDGDDGSVEMPQLMGARVRRLARAMLLAPLALARAVVGRLRRAHD
jgi:hypothetical protein